MQVKRSCAYTSHVLPLIQLLRSRPLRQPDRGNMLQRDHVVGLESMLDFSIYVFGDLDAIKVAKLYWPLSRKSS